MFFLIIHVLNSPPEKQNHYAPRHMEDLKGTNTHSNDHMVKILQTEFMVEIYSKRVESGNIFLMKLS